MTVTRLVGENTDGKGFLRSLREDAGYGTAGRSIVVFGAGGAARAITVELALTGASHITVVNRIRHRGAKSWSACSTSRRLARRAFVAVDRDLSHTRRH